MKRSDVKKVITNYLSKNKKNKIIIASSIALLILIIVIPFSLAALTPVKSVVIQSEQLSYTDSKQGSWQVTKSAEWISRGKARITFSVASNIKTNNAYTDVILVLDTSGSMNLEKLDRVKGDTTDLVNNILTDTNNNVALITFNTTSEIVTDFTNDKDTLVNSINNLEARGSTNYYQALVNVDTILKDYQKEENRDCVVLFLTDGYPNIEAPNEVAQYSYLKSAYPYLTINGIQYEMGEELLEPLKKITDTQYIANMDTLNTFLYKASVAPVAYEKFKLVDYINNDYFSISDVSEVQASMGEVTLENEDGVPKVTWTVADAKTGTDMELTIDIALHEELVGEGGIYPTNIKEEITSTIGDITENITSELTPVLADNYSVIYDGNAPADCTISNVPETSTGSVFDTIEISTQEPICEGYKFKGWKIVTEEVEKVNDDYFIMPESDVTLRAVWSKLSLSKSMDGKISKVQTLYTMMADSSTLDNIKSDYVNATTGINFKSNSSSTNGLGIYADADTIEDEYPIYYYRGAVTDNNVKFANFCWKIVRTTTTGGVKLIYNGVPNEDGSCTATGEDAQIGKSQFNSSYNSLAYNGYMYGTVYTIKTKLASIVGLGGYTQKSKGSINTSNYIYASSVTYDETTGLYTLVNGENRVWNDTYSVDTGNQYLYTCLSETETTCATVKYLVRSQNANNMYYAELSGGVTAEKILNQDITYSNDVTYDETTGLYTLSGNTTTSKIGDWATDYKIIGGASTAGYHYTCFNNTTECKTVNYIYQTPAVGTRDIGTIYYIEISEGRNLTDMINEMTINSTNTTPSTIKTKIDTWYEENMLDYTSKLEDTVWCNDRRIGLYRGWEKDGNAINHLVYRVRSELEAGRPTTTCDDKTNAFTVDDEVNGNGKLDYPVALLTADEITLAGGKVFSTNTNYYLYTGAYWWSLSPSAFNINSAIGFLVNSSGYFNNVSVLVTYGVRPSVSLVPGTRSVDGDGSPEDPFVIE